MMAVWGCHSPAAKAAETWSRTGLTCPTPMTLGLPSMPPSHMCNAQVFQSTDEALQGKHLLGANRKNQWNKA